MCVCVLSRRNNTGIRLSEYPVALSVPYAAHSKDCNKGTFTALVSPTQWPTDERLAPHSFRKLSASSTITFGSANALNTF